MIFIIKGYRSNNATLPSLEESIITHISAHAEKDLNDKLNKLPLEEDYIITEVVAATEEYVLHHLNTKKYTD